MSAYLISADEYQGSVAAGRDDIIAKVEQLTDRCGRKTRFVLAGFSQGAHALTEALWSLPADYHRQIESVILIASPVYRYGEAQKQLGDGDQSWTGLLGSRELPDWVQARTADLCLTSDVVCTSSGTWHAAYSAPHLRRAGRWAARRAMHPLPTETPRCDGRRATHIGSAGDDIIRGASGEDVIVAKGGNDSINGDDGDDTVCAGPGDDVIWGRWGNDQVFAGSGDDTARGGLGDDVLRGGAAKDRCIGGHGNDTTHPTCEVRT